jgi:hypothetical protein
MKLWHEKEEENLSYMKGKKLRISPSLFPHLFGDGIECVGLGRIVSKVAEV